MEGYDPTDPFQYMADSQRHFNNSGSREFSAKRIQSQLKRCKRNFKKYQKHIDPRSNILHWPVHFVLSVLILSINIIQEMFATIDAVRGIKWRKYYQYYKKVSMKIVSNIGYIMHERVVDPVMKADWKRYHENTVIIIMQCLDWLMWRPQTILVSDHKERMNELDANHERTVCMLNRKMAATISMFHAMNRQKETEITKYRALQKKYHECKQEVQCWSDKVTVKEREIKEMEEESRLKTQKMKELVQSYNLKMEEMNQREEHWKERDEILKQQLMVREERVNELTTECANLKKKHERKVQKLNRRYEISQDVVKSQQQKLIQCKIDFYEVVDEQEEENNELNIDRIAWIWRLRSKEQEIEELEEKYAECKAEKESLRVKLEQREKDWRNGRDAEMKRMEVVFGLRLKEKDHQISKLRGECDSLRMESEALKKAKQVMDVQNYRNWTEDQFCDWIVSIDGGKFKVYEEELRQSFLKEGVNGVAIPHINKTEWKGWGVDSFMHRTELDLQIKKLLDGVHDDAEIAGVEGQSTAYF